jgi:acetyl esterase/lipase
LLDALCKQWGTMSVTDIISTLVPKDRGAQRIAQGLAYGPEQRQRLDVYAPRRPSAAPLPVIVFFYGGAWSDGERGHYAFAARALAALGCVVVVPDYRLVPEVEYPDFLCDCAAAVRWVAASIGAYGGDPGRLVLAGHSAGAYNAAMLTLDPSWIGDATIQRLIAGAIGLSGPYDFHPFDGPISRRVFGQAEDPQGTQPINHVDASSPPMLLISGGRDQLVLPRNSERLGAALNAAGVVARVHIYPKLAHGETLLALSLPLRWMAPVLDECRQFLKTVT